ncbi:hypothetical protein CPB85DRAFT_1323438, partial [Mucidula mucida]
MLKYGKRCHRAEEEREGQSTDPDRSQDRNGMENDANLEKLIAAKRRRIEDLVYDVLPGNTTSMGIEAV